MAVEARDADTEDVETTAAPDRRPPPPPDRPGDDGFPSRADSRAGAAAANDANAPATVEGRKKPAVSETTERSDGRAGMPADEEEDKAESDEDKDAALDRPAAPSLGERISVDDKPLREYLDPVGAAAWSNEIGDQPGNPGDRKGDRTADTEGGENTRAERLRKKFHREGTDALDTVGKAGGHVKDILSSSPAGYTVERPGPVASTASHDAFPVSDTLTALMATGVVLGETVRFVRTKFTRERGHENGDNG